MTARRALANAEIAARLDRVASLAADDVIDTRSLKALQALLRR